MKNPQNSKAVTSALDTPTPGAAKGPTKNMVTGLTAERAAAAGPLTISNEGGTEPGTGDWRVMDSNGTTLNGPITTPQGLAYWIKQRTGYAARVENLNDLGIMPAHNKSDIYNGGGHGEYSLADVARGKHH